MPLTIEQLKSIMPLAGNRAALFLPHINRTLTDYQITSRLAVCAFLAQLAHESGEFRFLREIWGPTPAQLLYEDRADLGNTEKGDGRRFCGRGLIQVTGRVNYRDCGRNLEIDLLATPERLEEPECACRSAGWFWNSRNLTKVAETGDFKKVTKLINGGLNGYEQRLAYYQRALKIITEETMAPFIAAALPALIEAAPSLIRIFGKGEQSEKNAQAAEKVVEIAKQVTGESTAEGAVTAIQEDPEIAAKFREEVHANRLELAELSEKSFAEAREFAKEYAGQPRNWPLEIVTYTILGIFALIVVAVLTWRFDRDIATMVIQAAIALASGAAGFWLGSSYGSSAKNVMLAKRE